MSFKAKAQISNYTTLPLYEQKNHQLKESESTQ